MRGKTDEEEESGLLQAREKYKQVSRLPALCRRLPALCGTPWAVLPRDIKDNTGRKHAAHRHEARASRRRAAHGRHLAAASAAPAPPPAKWPPRPAAGTRPAGGPEVNSG